MTRNLLLYINGRFLKLSFLGICIALCVAGCGSDGGNKKSKHDNPSDLGTIPTGELTWREGVFEPAETLQAKCEEPRSGINPQTGEPYPDEQGSTLYEKYWLRSWMNDIYLWYDEIIDRDPIGYDLLEYFELLKTEVLLPFGKRKDRYSWAMPTEEFAETMQSGVSIGYGISWAIFQNTPPRDFRVAYTEDNTSARNAPANLARGARLLAVDNVDFIHATGRESLDILKAGIYPENSGETHTFTVLDQGSDTPRTFTMVSGRFESTPVQLVQTIPTDTGVVGYMLFNDFIATAEAQLIDAVELLASEGITDLIIDLRYNGGGYLAISSELAYMVAGYERTAYQIFERPIYNDKYPTENPFTKKTIEPWPFFSSSVGFSAPARQPLPTLNLNRLFVLTTAGTASASEALINGLRGIDIEVIQVGTTTYGKPVGMVGVDNCGMTYVPISFIGENAKGFSDYFEGFSPSDDGDLSDTTLPGCRVPDDFEHNLGDSTEAMLEAALFYSEHGACPEESRMYNTLSAEEAYINKPEPLRNAILRKGDL